MSERSAGVALVTLAGAVALGAVFAASRDVFTLLVCGGTWAMVLYLGCKSVPRTPDPAPPPPPERGSEEKPQFRVVEDPKNPNHLIVVYDKETGTT